MPDDSESRNDIVFENGVIEIFDSGMSILSGRLPQMNKRSAYEF